MNYSMLDKIFKYTTKNIYLIFFIIFTEYFNIFLEIISITCKLIEGRHADTITQNLNKINPYILFINLLNCKKVGEYNLCTFSTSAQNVILLLFFLFYWIFYFIAKYEDSREISLSDEYEKKNEKLKIFKFFAQISANLIYFIFHSIGMFLLFILTNFILFFAYSVSLKAVENTVLTVLLLLFSCLFYHFFVKFYFTYVRNLNIIVQFHEELKFHSDNIFSKNFDFFLIFLKILIAIQNNLILFEWNENGVIRKNDYKISFFAVLIIFSVFYYNLFLFYKVFSRKKILYLINTELNVFRIFLVNFTSFFLLSELIFHKQMNDPILFSITIFTIFLSSIYVTYCLKERNKVNIFKSRDFINQIAYVISKKNSYSEEKLNEIILNLFLLHKLNCNMSLKEEVIRVNFEEKKNFKNFSDQTNFCQKDKKVLLSYSKVDTKKSTGRSTLHQMNTNCKICKESEFTFETFLNSFYVESKLKMKSTLEKFSEDEIELFTMIELLHLNILKRDKITKLYFKIVKILSSSHYKSKNFSLFLNINQLKHHIDTGNFEDIRTFKILKTYEETSSLLKRIIEISDNIYTCYEFDKEIYKNAEKINFARDEILQKILTLFKFSLGNKLTEDLYRLILFKKIYEEIFNMNVDHLFPKFDLYEFEYKFTEKFENDKIITVNYDVPQDNFIITRASGELKIFNKKRLEEIFHEKFKIIARERFLRLIKENEVDNFKFEFLIKNAESEFYFQNMILKGKVFPSLNFNEVIVNANYILSGEDFIVFEQNFIKSEKRILNGFSKNVENLLGITEEMVRSLDTMKLSFEDIFIETQKNISEIDEKVEKIKKSKNLLKYNYHNQNRTSIGTNSFCTSIECKFNLIHFINLCLRINSIINSNEEDRVINQIELDKLKNTTANTIFILQLRDHIKREFNSYLIYSIQLLKKTSNKSLQKASEMDSPHDDKTSEKNVTQTTSTTLSYISNADRDVNYFQNTKMLKKSKNSSVNLNRLTTFTSIFILFLVTYSFIFMIFGILDNQRIKQFYSVLMNFQEIKKTLYHSYTSIFNQFLLADGDGKYFDHSYNPFFEKFNSKIEFDQISMIEIKTKIDYLQKRMLLFNDLYISSYFKDEIEKILNNQIDYKVISSINGEFSITSQKKNFFENLKTFMNLARIIFDSDENLVIDMIDYKNGEINFELIKNRNYESRQIFAMEIIINYLNIFIQSDSISTSLQTIQNVKLKSIHNLTLFFFISFIIFHLTLILICFFLMASLRTLIGNYLRLIDNLFSNKNVTYMKKKLSILKVLNELYLEDPARLLKKLKHNKKVFSDLNRNERREKEKIKIATDEVENNQSYKDWENSKKFTNSRNEILVPIFKTIICVFSLFYAYAFIFYFLIHEAHQKFERSSLIFSMNSENENYLFNNYNLLQFIFFTNNSDSNLYQLIKSQAKTSNPFDEQLYIKSQIQSIQMQTVHIANLIDQDRQFEILTHAQSQLMNCNYLYTDLNDDILTAIYKYIKSKDSLEQFLIEVCRNLPFMQNDEVYFVQQEMNYYMQQTLFKYETNINDKKQILSLFYEPTFDNLYYILIYIFRPIQQYVNYTLIFDIVDDQENLYLLILLLFLTLNILVDVVIFIFIKFYIIKKVLNTSTYIENFIDAIRIV